MMFNPVLWRIMLLPEYQVLGRLPRPGYDSISRGQSGNLRTTTRLHTFALLHPKIVGEISKSRKKTSILFHKQWNSLCTRAAPFKEPAPAQFSNILSEN